MPTASPSATLSASTSANLQSPHKKYSTMAGIGPGGSGKSNGTNGTNGRTSVKGLFGEDSDLVSNGGSVSLAMNKSHGVGGGSGFTNGSISRGSANLNHSSDGPWSISVAEVQPSAAISNTLSSNSALSKRSSRRASSKSGQPSLPPTETSYTLYFTTPTHNLTLLRSAAEIIELDLKLREGQSSANVLPKLPKLISQSNPTSTPPTGGRRLFQTISRTLSPGANKNRSALSNLTASGMGLAQVDTNVVANHSDAPTGTSTPTGKIAAPLPSSEITSSGNSTPSSAHTTTTHLATYLTSISNIPFIKKHKAWRRFTHVRSDDLQSVRVERRVRKVRSDLAQHVGSSVAPTNTNVGPSHSDLDEDADVEETENENASLSGRSTGHSQNGQTIASSSSSSAAATAGVKRTSTMRSDTSSSNHHHQQRPEVPLRSTSVDAQNQSSQETSSLNPNLNSNASSARNSRSIVNGIPEDQEKEKEFSDSRDQDSEMKDASREESAPQDEDLESISNQTKSKDISHRSRRSEKKRREKVNEKVTVDDFEMIRVLGKGCAGKVLLVRHSPTKGLFAMKSIHKRHVLAHQELQHTLTEQAVLKRMAREVTDPFVVKLWWSFHDKNNLYLVMDFHPGGDLATQLSRWGRLGRDRARFYAAEIVEGVEGLHKAGVIYRDLKPENILIGSDGHIVLSDFGLSKEFPVRGSIDNGGGSSTPPPTSPGRSNSTQNVKGRPPHWMSASEDGSGTFSNRRSSGSGKLGGNWADERDVTTTFCGTAEYLAPEVIQGSAYSYEVDWWSFGTMLYEMLTGITPFWADTHADMYVRVLHDELVFPDDRVLDQDTKSVLRGLLQRNPMLRMKEPRIKKHPYFSMIEWAHVFHKRYIPPYIPPIDPLNETDTQNFDEAFLDMQPTIKDGPDEDEEIEGTAGDNSRNETKQGEDQTSNGADDDHASPKTDGNGEISHEKSDSADSKSLFDGYSFRGRRDSESIHTVLSSGPSEPEKDESEDEDSAARAAVAALARLERDASSGDVSSSSPSANSSSTRPTSAAPTSVSARTSDSEDTPMSTSTSAASNPLIQTSKPPRVSTGLPVTHETIVEADGDIEEEEDDWDMVDGSVEKLQSEMNGGKGANLFARGVVDTYRLLRRQDSSRLPLSDLPTSTSSRSFNRLSKRQGSSSNRRTLVKSTSRSNLASRKTSLDSANGGRSGDDEISRSGKGGTLSTSQSNSVSISQESQQRKGASPSLASSDEVANSEKKQKLKKIKRFANFFESSR